MLLRIVAGGETKFDSCECDKCGLDRLVLPLGRVTCVEGGGVRDEGITVAVTGSSLISVLKDWFGSFVGEAGTSVDGSVTWDDSGGAIS